MIDYTVYTLSAEERRKYYAVSALVLLALVLLFYRSALAAVFGLPLIRAMEKHWAARKAEKRREALLDGFRDALYSLSTSISAGRQLPEAIRWAAVQAGETAGPASDIAVELFRIASLYDEAHTEIETLLQDFARRSGLEEIRQFADVCDICRKTGADLEKVALTGAELVLDRIHFRREVRMLTAQKKLDTMLLVALPLFILLFLNACAPAYLAVLYRGAAGRLIMTVCLLTVFGALALSLRMIEVTM